MSLPLEISATVIKSILRLRGPCKASVIAQNLRDIGYKNCRKTDVNRILYADREVEHHLHCNVPVWKMCENSISHSSNSFHTTAPTNLPEKCKNLNKNNRQIIANISHESVCINKNPSNGVVREQKNGCPLFKKEAPQLKSAIQQDLAYDAVQLVELMTKGMSDTRFVSAQEFCSYISIQMELRNVRLTPSEILILIRMENRLQHLETYLRSLHAKNSILR